MTDRYCDNTVVTGTLRGTWTIASGNTIVAGSLGVTMAATDCSVSTYVSLSDPAVRKAWYKVTTIANNTSLTLNTTWQEASTGPFILCKNSASGANSANAYCHPEQWSTYLTQVAGETLWFRGGQTHYFATDQHDWSAVSGSEGAPISWIGDNNGGKFGTASAGNPILMWKQSRITCITTDTNWNYFKNLTFGGCYDTGDTRMILMTIGGYSQKLENCFFTGSGTATANAGMGGDGFIMQIADGVCSAEFKNCQFDFFRGSFGFAVGDLNRGAMGTLLFNSCYMYSTTNGLGTAWRLIQDNGGCSRLDIVDSLIGYDTTGAMKWAGTGLLLYGTNAYIRNSCFGGSSPIAIADYPGTDCRVYVQDFDRTYLRDYQYLNTGKIRRDEDIIRSGGADYSVLMSPIITCNSWLPLTFQKWPYEIPVLITDTAKKIVSMYVYTSGFLKGLSAKDIYLQASYYNGNSTDRVVVVSTDQVASTSTWCQLSVPITAAQSGLALMSLYLTFSGDSISEYSTDGHGIYVDPIPVIS